MPAEETYAILTRSARLTGDSGFHEQLSGALEKFSRWHELVTLGRIVRGSRGRHSLRTGQPISTKIAAGSL